MDQIITPAPVVRQVRVKATPERAFDVFAGQMGRWWPKSHSIGESAIADVIVEPRAGGRLYERGEDGAECEWGRVIAYEPPTRLLLAWQLNADWVFDPQFEVEVDVRFVPDDGQTLVTLEHRNLERYGARATEIADSIGGEAGWPDILASFVTLVSATA